MPEAFCPISTPEKLEECTPIRIRVSIDGIEITKGVSALTTVFKILDLPGTY